MPDNTTPLEGAEALRVILGGWSDAEYAAGHFITCLWCKAKVNFEFGTEAHLDNGRLELYQVTCAECGHSWWEQWEKLWDSRDYELTKLYGTLPDELAKQVQEATATPKLQGT